MDNEVVEAPIAETAKEEPSDFMIGHNPEKVKSKFLLIMTRTQPPFMVDTVLFAIDRFTPVFLENDGQYGKERAIMAYEGYNKKDELVVRFPANNQYLLVNRSAYRPVFEEGKLKGKLSDVPVGQYV